MPFRGHEDPKRSYIDDPLGRFFALEAAFELSRGLLGDRIPLRLASVNLVPIPGDPAELAARTIAFTQRVSEGISWRAHVDPSLRLLIATLLLKHGDQPEAFLAEVTRVGEMMDQVALRRDPVFRILTILVLRMRLRGQPITRETVARVKAIYEAMKSHHWILTGPEDLPACAFMACQAGEPKALGRRASDIFHALNQEAGMWRSDALQSASNVLALGGLEVDEVAARFSTLASALREADQFVWLDQYDEVALLCFLARPIPRIVETVTSYREQFLARLEWVKPTAFSLATNLTAIQLLADDPELGPLADAKSLLDMQTIVVARSSG